jgi:hypothetical protein
MQQIAGWLEELGMTEYVPRFAENGITTEALRHLTDEDLKEIGVLLGHRRIMLAAIADHPAMAVGGATGGWHTLGSHSDARQVDMFEQNYFGVSAASLAAVRATSCGCH